MHSRGQADARVEGGDDATFEALLAALGPDWTGVPSSFPDPRGTRVVLASLCRRRAPLTTSISQLGLSPPPQSDAMVGHVNQSKGDRDFREWTPEYDLCHYVTGWIGTKIRWQLTVDQLEKDVVVAQANACPNKTLKVMRV